jgi:hypothetical protein
MEVGRIYDVDKWEDLSEEARQEVSKQLVRARGPGTSLGE